MKREGNGEGGKWRGEEREGGGSGRGEGERGGEKGVHGYLSQAFVLQEVDVERLPSSGIDLLLALEDFFCFLFLPLDLFPGSLTDLHKK